MQNINNYEDIMDSRDIIEKVDDLETDISDKETELENEINELDIFEEELEKLNDQINDDDGSDPDALFEVERAASQYSVSIANQECTVDELREDFKDLEEELKPIKEFATEGENCGDWEYGVTLIRKSYWIEYVQELAEDIGAVSSDSTWPNNHIDWEAAAAELLIDYTTLDFDGETYYMRA